MPLGSASQWFRRVVRAVLATTLCQLTFAQSNGDPEKLIEQAERLAWLKAWTRAAPLYAEAERLYATRGDRRNTLYAQINKLQGQLPQLLVPEVSQCLAEYLEDPIVQSDERLRLQTLIIKGETDVDLDPFLAEQSWSVALNLADRLGEAAWANRAHGELGLVAFLLGDINNAVIKLGQALKVAESNRDVASLVRWLTLFGHGYVQLDRPEQALDFHDRALTIATAIPELQFPLMTYLGKGNALVRLGRFAEAEDVLKNALAVATRDGALGCQAELTLMQGQIAYQRKQADQALELLAHAADLARKAGGNRILAEISLELARIQRASGKPAEADKTMREGIEIARNMAERLLLPRLLALLADLRVSEQRYPDAAVLLEEATDMLEGLLQTPAARGCGVGSSGEWTMSSSGGFASRVYGPILFGCSQSLNGRGVAHCWNYFLIGR
jgi:tetratricopeptide (TPR) repeat protein